jgi:hypothetical protein
MFFDYIKKAKLDLYTVEMIFEGQSFQLTEKDATVLKQIRAKDVMFQKERMLNIALDLLPSKYDQVIWMDCDLFFFEKDWPERVAKALETYQVVQPYNIAISLPLSKFEEFGEFQTNIYDCFGSGRIKKSYAAYQSSKNNHANFHHGHVGYVWAARREFINKHKLYDPIITGAGDLFMLMAFTGNFGWLDYPEELRGYDMNAATHFFDWGFPVYKDTQGKIGHTSDVIFHMWHGDINNRNYLDLSKALQKNRFNPQEDLKLEINGSWKWASDKPKLHQAVKNIFKIQ